MIRREKLFPIARSVARAFFSLIFKMEVCGQENLPAQSAFVLLPKHRRWEDIPLLGLASPRQLYYVAKHELFTNAVSGWFLSALGGIPLNRLRPMESRQSLRVVHGLLGKGKGIVVFPEGTYYRHGMGPARVGLIRMILSHSKVPFIPVGVRYEARGLYTEVLIHFGRPIWEDSGVKANVFIAQIMKEIAQLSGLSHEGEQTTLY